MHNSQNITVVLVSKLQSFDVEVARRCLVVAQDGRIELRERHYSTHVGSGLNIDALQTAKGGLLI